MQGVLVMKKCRASFGGQESILCWDSALLAWYSPLVPAELSLGLLISLSALIMSALGKVNLSHAGR